MVNVLVRISRFQILVGHKCIGIDRATSGNVALDFFRRFGTKAAREWTMVSAVIVPRRLGGYFILYLPKNIPFEVVETEFPS